jgi:hypothetical protein
LPFQLSEPSLQPLNLGSFCRLLLPFLPLTLHGRLLFFLYNHVQKVLIVEGFIVERSAFRDRLDGPWRR